MAVRPVARYAAGVDAERIDLAAVAAALVTLFFFVSGACAAAVAVSAIRTRTYAPQLGLDVQGVAARVAGWVTLVLALALFAAGVLVSYVEMGG